MEKKISCVIHTYNSDRYLNECLSSVAWCDEIVIIDMYSTDRTLSIARDFDAKIYMHENVGYADPARAFGLSKCSFDYVLALDSDELVSPKLRDRILKEVNDDKFDVLKISFRNYFFGREILGSGWGYKDQVIARFFKKGYLNYGKEVHNFNKIEKKARVGQIIGEDVSIIHFNYDSVRQFIRKLNTYTDNEVYSTKYIYRGKPSLKIIYHFLRETIGRFIYKKGYRDGWVGLYLALAMAFYRASSVAKSNLKNEDDVVQLYKNQVANKILNESK